MLLCEFIPSVFREISLIGITDGAPNVFCKKEKLKAQMLCYMITPLLLGNAFTSLMVLFIFIEIVGYRIYNCIVVISHLPS